MEDAVYAPALGGCLGFRSDLLERAAHIALTFYRTSQWIYEYTKEDPQLSEQLLRPLAPLPGIRAHLREEPFFLRFFRMDFFLDHEEDRLWIIEVNSGGGGLPDLLRCAQFLREHWSFDPPGPFHLLDLPTVLHCLIESIEERQRPLCTLGFVAIENGNEDYLPDYLEYARWLSAHTEITPVLLALERGTLSLFPHPAVPCPLENLSQLDAIVNDWFEDLPCLERLDHSLREKGVTLAIPRTDLLFESKSFLTILQHLPQPPCISGEDWALLQEALIPSFPLEDFVEYADEMAHWPGTAVKMDLDCASEHVHLFDFRTRRRSEALRFLEKKREESRRGGVTWTVQALRHPRTIASTDAAPWLPDYSHRKFDLMTFIVQRKGVPHVFFGSRQFSREKIDELSEEGRKDGLLSPVCAFPCPSRSIAASSQQTDGRLRT
jgi:hypothetical protein